jgi:hypothetical protein
MEYIGAADYYFWQGVETAQNKPRIDAEDHADLTFGFNNDCTRACIEAYRWGLCLGQVLTGEEFKELTTHKEYEIIKIEYKNIEEDVNTLVKGNC